MVEGSEKTDKRKIEVQNQQIILFDSNEIAWRVKYEDIAVVGEMTNDSGPWFDDHFLILVLREFNSEVKWYEISSDVNGFEHAMKNLSTLLKISLELRLVNITNFESVVLWPQEIQGMKLFRFNRKTHNNIFEGFYRLFFPQIEQEIADSVKSFILSQSLKE